MKMKFEKKLSINVGYNPTHVAGIINTMLRTKGPHVTTTKTMKMLHIEVPVLTSLTNAKLARLLVNPTMTHKDIESSYLNSFDSALAEFAIYRSAIGGDNALFILYKGDKYPPTPSKAVTAKAIKIFTDDIEEV